MNLSLASRRGAKPSWSCASRSAPPAASLSQRYPKIHKDTQRIFYKVFEREFWKALSNDDSREQYRTFEVAMRARHHRGFPAHVSIVPTWETFVTKRALSIRGFSSEKNDTRRGDFLLGRWTACALSAGRCLRATAA